MRQRQPLVFGGGLDRSTGAMEIGEESFFDLRNVYLYNGKAELRRGLYETLTFDSGEVVFYVAPIRSQAIGAIFTFEEATGEVKLYRCNGAGTSTIYVGVVWTLPDTSGFPLINADDSYGKLYIAHDEPVYANRQKSKVYDPFTGTIDDYEQDLYSSTSGAVASYFRGFRRHLNYIVGWGYGSENSGDEDRPEIMRISMPGDPDTMKPLHYAIVGQRSEAINAVSSVQGRLIFRKESDSYVLTGESNANFGVGVLDALYGAISSRLSVVVGGVDYFWSLHGPRMSGVGPSTDLAELLDLAGPVPDALAAATSQEYGFACYDPREKEVLFVFGQWAYVLHIRNPDELRWSYRRYEVAMAGGGLLYSGIAGPPAGGGGGGGTGAGAPVAYPEITDITEIGNSGFTLEWDNVGVLAGGELAEIWCKKTGDAWFLAKDNVAVAGPGESEDVDGLTPGAHYDVAVRFKLVGVYTAGYTSSDPFNWPPVSRTSIDLSAALTAPTEVVAALYCESPGVTRLGATWVIEDGDKERIERSSDGGATWEELTYRDNPSAPGNPDAQDWGADFDTYYYFRIRHENTAGDEVSDWAVVDVGSLPTGACG